MTAIRLRWYRRCRITDGVPLPSGRLQSALEGGFLFCFGGIEVVPELTTNQIREALNFSRFRFKLIAFLKLPFDIREPALREFLERSCGGVYRNYLARAERVEDILKSEATLESENTLEMNFCVPLVSDHRQSDSLNR